MGRSTDRDQKVSLQVSSNIEEIINAIEPRNKFEMLTPTQRQINIRDEKKERAIDPFMANKYKGTMKGNTGMKGVTIVKNSDVEIRMK